MLDAPEMFLLLPGLVILVGDKKLPELGSGLGKGIREFRKALGSDKPEEEQKQIKEYTVFGKGFEYMIVTSIVTGQPKGAAIFCTNSEEDYLGSPPECINPLQLYGVQLKMGQPHWLTGGKFRLV